MLIWHYKFLDTNIFPSFLLSFQPISINQQKFLRPFSTTPYPPYLLTHLFFIHLLLYSLISSLARSFALTHSYVHTHSLMSRTKSAHTHVAISVPGSESEFLTTFFSPFWNQESNVIMHGVLRSRCLFVTWKKIVNENMNIFCAIVCDVGLCLLGSAINVGVD